MEEVLTVDPDDADNLHHMLSTASVVHYDVRRRTLMFGTTPVERVDRSATRASRSSGMAVPLERSRCSLSR